MDLNKWAIKHNIGIEALNDLKVQMGLWTDHVQATSDVKSEALVSDAIRLEAAKKGILLWRNNVGAMQDETGRVIRFGLANDSQKVNKHIKSSDLIGIRPNGQFICREVKASNWQYTGTEREVAQKKFIELVLSHGGDAAFATKAGEL
jgi:hypothetical protein